MSIDKQNQNTLVLFRPSIDYVGQFGFDWIRKGDTKLKADIPYKRIVGEYEQGVFIRNKKQFELLKETFKQENHVMCPNGKYNVPVLAIRKGQIARLNLIIESKIDDYYITLEYNKSLLQVEVPQYHTKVKRHRQDYSIQIKCLNSFEYAEYIKVFANDTFAGKLELLPNSSENFKNISIKIIEVRTNFEKYQPTELIHHRVNELTQNLSNARISTEIEYLKLNLTEDNKFKQKFIDNKAILNGNNESILDYLNTCLLDGKCEINDSSKHSRIDNKEQPYKNSYKVYVFDSNTAKVNGKILLGNSYGISSPERTVVVYKEGLQGNTITHEMFHAMGLHHSYSNRAKFTFKRNSTDNVMDYNPTATNKSQNNTWQWQWDILRRNCNNL